MADVRLGSMIAERHGAGPAVVMVHGLGGSSNSFQPLMTALEDFCVLRPDLPGAGRSAFRPGRSGLAGLADAVRNCLRAQDIPRAHFVGHSMGTLICQQIAVTAPDQVLSLTLLGAILEPAPPARDALKARAGEAASAGMAGIAAAVSSGSVADAAGHPVVVAFVRESLMRQNATGYAVHCEALSTARAVDHAEIRCPTLIVQGAADPVAPPEMAARLAARIDGAALEVLAGVGHWPMLEAPVRTARLLRAHLEAVAS